MATIFSPTNAILSTGTRRHGDSFFQDDTTFVTGTTNGRGILMPAHGATLDDQEHHSPAVGGRNGQCRAAGAHSSTGGLHRCRDLHLRLSDVRLLADHDHRGEPRPRSSWLARPRREPSPWPAPDRHRHPGAVGRRPGGDAASEHRHCLVQRRHVWTSPECWRTDPQRRWLLRHDLHLQASAASAPRSTTGTTAVRWSARVAPTSPAPSSAAIA